MERTLYPAKTNVLTIIPTDVSCPNLFGIELEIEFPSEEMRAEFIPFFYSDPLPPAILTHERSILCGVEIVTAPVILSELPHVIKLIIEKCRRGGATVSHRTGLHIHVSRAGLTVDPLEIFRFINNPVHREEIIGFAGRLSDYARFTTRPTPKPHRGYALNLLPATTLEFRLFDARIDDEWIIGSAWFCQLLCKAPLPRSYAELIDKARREGAPMFVITRLESVPRTPLRKVYPPTYPAPCAPQYW